MEIRIDDNFCIITPLSQNMDKRASFRLFNELKLNLGLKIGINMEEVNNCSIEFIECIKNFKNLALFNLNSDIFALFNVMNIDKTLELYVCEEDFVENKHRILNRKFFLV